jgi:hypothetical protein
MSRKTQWSALLIALILSLATGTKASAYCIDSSDLTLAEVDGDYFCGYSGGGCSSCYAAGARGGDSWDICYYDWATTDEDCTAWD